jgi:molybdopterin synthase sulfur carrier subunit
VTAGAVRIVLPGVLREDAGGLAELRVELDGTTSLRGILDAATVSRPRLDVRMRDETGALRRHVNVFVDGEDVRRGNGLDTTVDPGAVVHVLPAVSGG